MKIRGSRPVLLLHPPTSADWNRLQAKVAAAALTYDAVGCSLTRLTVLKRPAGFNVDSAEAGLGMGRQTYERARDALAEWRMFPRPMTRLLGAERPPQAGQIVAVVFRPLGLPLWGAFPCRVLTAGESHARECSKYEMSYGTLPGHAESGEELFRVEWDYATDRVYYEIFAVSRPHTFLARLGYPYCRYQQAKFRRLSCAAMQSAVGVTTC